MRAEQYKVVKAAAVAYIKRNEPLKAARIHEQYASQFTQRQYYELHDIILKAIKENVR